MLDNFNEIINRRFGSRYEHPCSDPNVLECTVFGCQKAGYCQKGQMTGPGSQLIRITPASRQSSEERS